MESKEEQYKRLFTDNGMSIHKVKVENPLNIMMSNKPIIECKDGGLRVSGWRTEKVSKNGKAYGTYSFKIEKRYFDVESEQYKETRYFKPEELLRLKEQISKAYHLSKKYEDKIKAEENAKN